MKNSHEKNARQVAILAEAIAINPNPSMDEIDNLRYFFEKLRYSIERKEKHKIKLK